MNEQETLRSVYKDNIFDQSSILSPRKPQFSIDLTDFSISNSKPLHLMRPLQDSAINPLQPQLESSDKGPSQQQDHLCKRMLQIANSSDTFGALLLPQLFKVAKFPLIMMSFILSYAFSIFSSYQILQLYREKQQVNVIKLAIVTNMTYNMISGVKMIVWLNHFLHSVFLVVVAGNCLSGIVRKYSDQDNEVTKTIWRTYRFWTLMAGILVTPFCLKIKYPNLLFACSRAMAFFALTIVVLGPLIYQVNHKMDLTSPIFTFNIFETIIAAPSLIMIFSYHQQYILHTYSKKLDKSPFNNNTLVTHSLVGTTYSQYIFPKGSLTILIGYFLLGTITFLTYDLQISSQYQNILQLTLNDDNIGNSLLTISFALFALTALIQCIQYNSLGLKIVLVFVDPESKQNKPYFIPMVAFLHHLLIVIAAVLICDINILITLIGAISQNLVSIILPCVMYIRVFSITQKDVSYYASYATLFSGLIFAFLVIFSLSLNLVDSNIKQ